jgi:chromosome segregation ATPase
LAAGFLYFYRSPEEAPEKDKAHANTRGFDLATQLQKKISSHEQKLKDIEYSLQAAQLELAQTKEKEKALLKERSQNTFDAQQYEKFKKEYQALKSELTRKEEALEAEITHRRRLDSQLLGIKTDAEVLKKSIMESEDAFRRSQAVIETLTRELNLAKKTIVDQKKIVQEHSENKAEGEWVSRIEFNKIEMELKEKESMIQKLLSLKKEQPPST